MTTATTLDHVGVGARDLAALAATYERLGFTLTPVARHRGKATWNRCAMLTQGYLELIAPADPAIPDRLHGQLDRYEGLVIVAFGMADTAGNLARLHRAGFNDVTMTPLERPVDEADPNGPIARFERLVLPDAPEGTIQLVKHLTPEAISQPRFTHHPNAAAALAEVVVAVPDPAETAARFSRLAGFPVVPDAVAGFALPLPRGRVRIVPPDAVGRIYPGVTTSAIPCIAGFTVATADRCAALRPILAGLDHAPCGEGALVAPAHAGGAALLFT